VTHPWRGNDRVQPGQAARVGVELPFARLQQAFHVTRVSTRGPLVVALRQESVCIPNEQIVCRYRTPFQSWLDQKPSDWRLASGTARCSLPGRRRSGPLADRGFGNAGAADDRVVTRKAAPPQKLYRWWAVRGPGRSPWGPEGQPLLCLPRVPVRRIVGGEPPARRGLRPSRPHPSWTRRTRAC